MFLDFKKWVKSIQTAGYNGACTVDSEWAKLSTHLLTSYRNDALAVTQGTGKRIDKK